MPREQSIIEAVKKQKQSIIMLPICHISLRAFLLGLVVFICSLLATQANLFFSTHQRKPEPVLLQTSFGGSVDEIGSELESLLLAALANDTDAQESERSDALHQYRLVEEEKLDNVDAPSIAATAMRDLIESYETEKTQKGKTEPSLKNETEEIIETTVVRDQQKPLSTEKAATATGTIPTLVMTLEASLPANESDTELSDIEPTSTATEIPLDKVKQFDLLEDEEEEAAEQQEQQETIATSTMENQENRDHFLIPTHPAESDLDAKAEYRKEAEQELPTIATSTMENQDHFLIPTHLAEPDLDAKAEDRKKADQDLSTIATSVMENQETQEHFMIPTHPAEPELDSKVDDRKEAEPDLSTIATTLMDTFKNEQDNVAVQDLSTIATTTMVSPTLKKQDSVADQDIPMIATTSMEAPVEILQEFPTVATMGMESPMTTEFRNQVNEAVQEFSTDATSIMESSLKTEDQDSSNIATAAMGSPHKTEDQNREIDQEMATIATASMEPPRKSDDVEQDMQTIGTTVMEPPVSVEPEMESDIPMFLTTTMESPAKIEFDKKDNEGDRNLPMVATTTMEKTEPDLATIGTTIMELPVNIDDESSPEAERDQTTIATTTMASPLKTEDIKEEQLELPMIATTLMETLFRNREENIEPTYVAHESQDQIKPARSPALLYDWIEPTKQHYDGIEAVTVVIPTVIMEEDEGELKDTFATMPVATMLAQAYNPDILKRETVKTIPTEVMNSEDRNAAPISTATSDAEGVRELSGEDYEWLAEKTIEEVLGPYSKLPKKEKEQPNEVTETATMFADNFEPVPAENEVSVKSAPRKSVQFATLPSIATMGATEDSFATTDSMKQHSDSDFDDYNDVSPTRPGSIMLWAVKHSEAREVPRRRSQTAKHPKGNVY